MVRVLVPMFVAILDLDPVMVLAHLDPMAMPMLFAGMAKDQWRANVDVNSACMIGCSGGGQACHSHCHCGSGSNCDHCFADHKIFLP